ncbi:MAG: (Fe-S)-binding protein [Salibacteraceae bacterium]
MMISSIVFLILLIAASLFFAVRIRLIRQNILLGRDVDMSDNKAERWRTMARVALGQGKMVARPLAGVLHIFVYAGFIIINLEVLEIVIDGIFGTHRIFYSLIGTNLYYAFIAAFEILALLVLFACVVFLIRRNIGKLKRFSGREMTLWPKTDANIILIVECLLMLAFLTMNAADAMLMMVPDEMLAAFGADKYSGFEFGKWFPVSAYLTGFLPLHVPTLVFVERFCWWFHIVGIFAFLVYIPYSKHLHIFLAFPNTYFSRLGPLGKFNNLESVKREVELMLDPNADPYAAPATDAATDAAPERFGAKDADDLSWKQLLDAYSCTECGRCTSECPANITGKILSPRKIMMDTRDRIEELGALKREKGNDATDGKSLINDYISPEELWACTTCNACAQACPVNINPLSIIIDLRRYLVMEESAAPAELNTMFTNIENNGAPWQFSQNDRANWRDEA